MAAWLAIKQQFIVANGLANWLQLHWPTHIGLSCIGQHTLVWVALANAHWALINRQLIGSQVCQGSTALSITSCSLDGAAMTAAERVSYTVLDSARSKLTHDAIPAIATTGRSAR
eukprot:3627-Chlamydomonas_euryale.AAC.4